VLQGGVVRMASSLTGADARTLLDVLHDGEDWLMQRILDHAQNRDYTRYSSTLLEAWRLSIVGLTDSIEVAVLQSHEVPELGPDDDPVADPLAQFGVQQALRHRSRGINLAMFLGLFKYYRQTYRELLDDAARDGVFEDAGMVWLFVDRVFDRIELGYTTAWAGTSAEQQIREMSSANRDATNQKNRLLTLIESLAVPALLIDDDGAIELMNHQAALLLVEDAAPGSTHYGERGLVHRPAWVMNLISELGAAPSLEAEVAFPVGGETRLFLAHVSHLVDVSRKSVGYAVALLDVTQDRANRHELLMASEVFTSTRDGVVVLDSEGRVVTVNPAFTALVGAKPEGLVGRPLDEILGTPLNLRAGQATELLGELGHWMGEVTLVPADGRSVTAWLSLSRVGWGVETDGETIGIFTDITPLKVTQQQLSHLARHDALTGLANRVELRDMLEAAVQSAGERGQRIGVLFLDLDRFKEINDTLGHEVGDEVLSQVAERLRGAMRGSDLLGRLGGDEFMIVAEDLARADQAELVAERAMTSLTQPIHAGDQDYVVTASMGISVFPDDGESVDELIRNADTAMYLAKAQGRATYRRYVPTLTEEAHSRMVMRNLLHRDVESRAFEVYYQPIISLADGTVAGVEALLRWFPAELGEVSPATFVPVLEDLGLIEAMGAWVLERSVEQLAAWTLANVPVPLVAVNVAPSQLEDARFETTVHDCLAAHGVKPSRLQLEVTEGTMFRVRSRGADVLRSLHQRGVTVAIDDFGTGYSSLGRLHELPISVLKVDRSFVTGLIPDPGRGENTMVSAIITLAHALDLTVTAEGVESDAIAESLRFIGCDRAQGFGYSVPLPAPHIPAFVSTQQAR
jgi:diguanylate cyclase (GGDEF)-like protein/PAS domain S-box-containing protein